MNRNRFWAALSKTLAAVTIILTVVLTFASSAAAAPKYKTLHKFNGKGAHSPGSSLVFDAAGNLYGTAGLGGKESDGCYFGTCGAVFELTPTPDGKWRERVLHYFDATDGTYPNGGVIFGADGNLYGVTNRGPGFWGNGVVF